jgi:predicted acetyltransferase
MHASPITPISESLHLRPGRLRDVLPLARLWALAFPGERTVEVRVQQLREGGTYGGIETCWVAEREGRLAGAFRMYDLNLSLFGIPCPTLGLAAVAVDPGFRRQGVGRQLCEAALRMGRERGDLLAALFPFRADFYGRLGFAPAGTLHRHRFAPKELLAEGEPEKVIGLAPDARRSVVPALYDDLLPAGHGPAHRTERMWAFLEEEETLVWALPGLSGTTLDGYLIAENQPPRGSRGAILVIRELLGRDASAVSTLWSWVACQGDQWAEVVYDALPGERFEARLLNARLPGSRMTRGLWFPTGTLLRGPMIRVLNLPALLELLGGRSAPEGGDRGLRTLDSIFPENAGTWGCLVDPPGDLEPDTTRCWTPQDVALGVVEGRLPGLQTLIGRRFRPLLGVPDFRLLDVF